MNSALSSLVIGGVALPLILLLFANHVALKTDRDRLDRIKIDDQSHMGPVKCIESVILGTNRWKPRASIYRAERHHTLMGHLGVPTDRSLRPRSRWLHQGGSLSLGATCTSYILLFASVSTDVVLPDLPTLNVGLTLSEGEFVVVGAVFILLLARLSITLFSRGQQVTVVRGVTAASCAVMTFSVPVYYLMVYAKRTVM